MAAALVMVSIPFAIGIVRAQSLPPEPAYTYEVVSVKPSQPGQTRTYFPGYRTQNATAMDLLTWAYRVHDYQVAGAPGWATSNRFDVTFTPDRKEPAACLQPIHAGKPDEAFPPLPGATSRPAGRIY